MAPTVPQRGGPRGFSSSSSGPSASSASGSGKYKPGMVGGKGKALINGGKRHRKIPRDTIKAISKADIRRLARRGGIKRISSTIYDDARNVMKDRITQILGDCVALVEHRGAKTITVSDVIFSLRRLGRPIYGFDPESYTAPGPGRRARAGAGA